MTAQILVVDDVPANVKLLEAKLQNEYYDVIPAHDGFEAIEQAKKHKPDLILLDVMMPGMDGFECCLKLKQDPETAFIPVVMVTALSEMDDRVRGLEAGADDFLTKPVNDTALFARVKSLIRIKMLTDELRLRDQTGLQMGVMDGGKDSINSDVSGSRILVIDDDMVQMKRIAEELSPTYGVELSSELDNVQNFALNGAFDLFLISTTMIDTDGLRLASQLKSQEILRHVPIIILVDEDDQHIILKGLEMGINDYVVVPVDANELKARVKTQIRRKNYQDALKANYQQSLSMAITDNLTGLYNRHYLNQHLDNMIREALTYNKPLSLMIMDMDHFKEVNDTYGHDCGDQVLKQLANIITADVRSSDLAARFGGEEFVILMPGTPLKAAADVAERIRRHVEAAEFIINHEVGMIRKTTSIGLSTLSPMGDSGDALLKRADEALYACKHSGRNCVKVAQVA